jgi:hypothetical protein
MGSGGDRSAGRRPREDWARKEGKARNPPNYIKKTPQVIEKYMILKERNLIKSPDWPVKY